VKFIKAIATVGVIIAMLLSAVIAKDYYKQYPKQTLIVTPTYFSGHILLPATNL
jgi:hypothetical protein